MTQGMWTVSETSFQIKVLNLSGRGGGPQVTPHRRAGPTNVKKNKKQNKTKQNKTKQNKTKQHKTTTVQSKIKEYAQAH
jgi:hypothetical protein